MHLLLTSDPIIQTGRAANYRSCTLEPWVDVEPGRERGNASPRRMTSDLGKKTKKKKKPDLLLLGLGIPAAAAEVSAAAASSFGEGVGCSRGYGYFFSRQLWNKRIVRISLVDQVVWGMDISYLTGGVWGESRASLQ